MESLNGWLDKVEKEIARQEMEDEKNQVQIENLEVLKAITGSSINKWQMIKMFHCHAYIT